jgi:hypothetical protein
VNTSKIRKATETIDSRTRALHWLNTHGLTITGKPDAVEAHIKITPYVGDEGDGEKEAVDLMQAYSLINLPQAIQNAIACCRNDIEIAREVIRQELETPDA